MAPLRAFVSDIIIDATGGVFDFGIRRFIRALHTVFLYPIDDLVGTQEIQERESTSRQCMALAIPMTPNNALQPTATALAVLRTMISRFIFWGFCSPQPRSSWLWLSLIR